MHTTPVSLLQRLRHPAAHEAWGRFTELYTPLLYYWAHRLGLNEHDACDLVQDVFTTLLQKLPQLEYDAGKGFRNWLRTIIVNRRRDQARRQAPHTTAALDLWPAPEADGLDETEYRQHLVNRALKLMQTEFSPRTWQACWQHVVADRPAREVAAELGISVGSVYVAKSRVLCRLRQELDGLLE